MSIIPRTDLALEFLKQWRPPGPWILTAIAPDNGQIETKTFKLGQFSEMENWIEKYNGIRNLYFTINPTRTEMDKKPSRTDISEICCLFVDCDPRVGESLEEEQKRILKTLTEFLPRPSIIISTGGGAQAFWLLEEPIVLDGKEETAIEAESYSVQLELLLGGDRTSNCDRVYRLPGTINLPNEVKRKKGRLPALSYIIEALWTRYPISLFTKAPVKIQSKLSILNSEQLPGGGEKIKISGNLTPVYVDDLIKKNIHVSDLVKVLIIHGHDPEDPNKYSSRSEPLFMVCCALVKAGADDDTIAGIILNKENAISKSVLDKPRPHKYAAKQIQNAREEADDPMLRELNSRHAVIGDWGGRCRIISETFDHALNRPRISYQAFQDFIHRYCNRKVKVAVDSEGKDVLKPAGQWWINHAKRRQYETVVFAPGKELPQVYNLWQGFACEAIPGDCDLFLNHIFHNLCQSSVEYSAYLLSWMARCVQHPDCAGEVAIVFRGEMGTGKGFFAKSFGSLFGRHFLQIYDSKHLVGSFNSHLRDCVVLFGDEAFYAGDKKHESVLKALVTEENLAIESKGVDLVASSNYTHLILASNSNWVVPAGTNERRFFVLDVGKDKMQNKKYFAAIKKQLDNGGREALLHFLLNYDISNFEVREVPATYALQDQKILSMSSEETWWYEKLEEGRLLREHDNWEREVMKQELQDDYISFMQKTGILRKASSTILGKFLGRVCPGGMPRSYQKMARIKVMGGLGEEFMVNRRTYFYELPELSACREHWDKYHGGPFKWSIPIEKENQIEVRSVFA